MEDRNLERQIIERLTRIETTLKAVHMEVVGHVSDDKIIHADIEKRVRKNEAWRYYAAGIAAAAGFFASNLKDFFLRN